MIHSSRDCKMTVWKDSKITHIKALFAEKAKYWPNKKVPVEGKRSSTSITSFSSTVSLSFLLSIPPLFSLSFTFILSCSVCPSFLFSPLISKSDSKIHCNTRFAKEDTNTKKIHRNHDLSIYTFNKVAWLFSIFPLELRQYQLSNHLLCAGSKACS